MANVWFTSDLHLGHNNICKYRQEFHYPDEHHWTILENLGGCVKKRDTLWISQLLSQIGSSLVKMDDISEFIRFILPARIILIDNDSDCIGRPTSAVDECMRYG